MELLTTCQTCRRARPREHLNSLADCDLALRARLWVGLSALHFGAPSLRCGVPCASRSAGRLRSLRNGADTRHSINRPRRSACGGLPPLRCDAQRRRGAAAGVPLVLAEALLARDGSTAGLLVNVTSGAQARRLQGCGWGCWRASATPSSAELRGQSACRADRGLGDLWNGAYQRHCEALKLRPAV